MMDTDSFRGFLNDPSGENNQIRFGAARVPGDTLDDANKEVLLSTQLLVAIPMGLIFFLIFCYLRTRWTTMFAPRSRLQKLAPDPLPTSFFYWVVPLYNTPESQILERVGLDAAVLLAFFKMSYKLFAFCAIVGFVVVGPIKFAEFIHLLPGKGGDGDRRNFTNVPAPLPIEDTPETPGELASYVILTWIFSFATFYFTFYNYREFAEIRHIYYLKWKDTIAARTVMVTVIPKKLQSDTALAEYYESLGLGSVESAVVFRHVRKLRHMIEKRAKYLQKLEEAYVDYLNNPCKDPNYHPDEALSKFESADDAKAANANAANVLQKVSAKRPTFPFTRIDKINYYTEKFFGYDKLVEAGRLGAYSPVPVGFVTFEDIASAQLAAQVLIYPEPFQCHTELAPEPRDIYWYNMTIRSREFFIRNLVINFMVVIIVLFWSGPISVFASLLSMQSLERFFPWLAHLAEKNEALKGFIQGTLPTLAVSIFNILLPKITIGLSILQGFKARSVIELSTFAKYYFFLLVNVLLIFSLVGSVAKNLQDIIDRPIGIPYKLATTLPQVSSFFVNFVVFQGIGIFPIHLLQLKEVAFTWVMRIFFSKTPRDYADASAPPFMNYGEELPPMVLIFVIVLVYSSLRPIAITFFGAIYFFLGYMCYKYLLLYVYFHPYETAGLAWPKIFRRIIIGLYIYQILMIGYLSLRKSYYLAASVFPILICTFVFFYYVNDAFEKASSFIPLKSLRDELNKVQTNTADVTITPKSPDNPNNSEEATNANRPPAAIDEEDTEEGHSHRDVLEDDLYHANPDLYTDYSQPPMSLYNGILNTGMRNYGPPSLVGVLPWLWLPVKRVPSDESAMPGAFHRLLGMNKIGSNPIPTRSAVSLGETEEERIQQDIHRQEIADAKIKLAAKRAAKDPNNPNRIYYHHPERRRSTLVSPINPPETSNNILDNRSARTSSPERNEIISRGVPTTSRNIPTTSRGIPTTIEIPDSTNSQDHARPRRNMTDRFGRLAGRNFG